MKTLITASLLWLSLLAWPVLSQAQDPQPPIIVHYLINDSGQIGSVYLAGGQIPESASWHYLKLPASRVCQASAFESAGQVYEIGTPITVSPLGADQALDICWRLTPNQAGVRYYQTTMIWNQARGLPVSFNLTPTSGPQQAYLLAGLYNQTQPVIDINHLPANNCDDQTDFSQAQQVDNFSPIPLDQANLGQKICLRATVAIRQAGQEQFHHYYASWSGQAQSQIPATNNHPVAGPDYGQNGVNTRVIILVTAVISVIGFIFVISLVATVFVIRFGRQPPPQV